MLTILIVVQLHLHEIEHGNMGNNLYGKKKLVVRI